MLSRSLLCCLVVWGLASSPVDAQVVQKPFTFNPRPLNQSRSFLLTEFTFGHRFGPGRIAGVWIANSGHVANWELGYMRNLSPRWSLGTTAFLQVDEDGGQFGIKPRVRYWLNRESSLDLAIGPIVTTFEDKAISNFGLTSHIGLNANSFWTFLLGMDVIHYKVIDYRPPSSGRDLITGNRVGFYGALRVGGVPGAVVGLLVPVAVYTFVYLAMPRDPNYF